MYLLHCWDCYADWLVDLTSLVEWRRVLCPVFLLCFPADQVNVCFRWFVLTTVGHHQEPVSQWATLTCVSYQSGDSHGSVVWRAASRTQSDGQTREMDIATSAQSLSVIRKFRSLGVIWGIFTICYNIIVWVVFTQVRDLLVGTREHQKWLSWLQITCRCRSRLVMM